KEVVQKRFERNWVNAQEKLEKQRTAAQNIADASKVSAPKRWKMGLDKFNAVFEHAPKGGKRTRKPRED
ncbi:MAG: hypothetical protein Q7R47_01950, partial [Candidatus Diapherotrites archaeon]|nr:hypothetical protein [Candidatus Diapherotrites archaeon]